MHDYLTARIEQADTLMRDGNLASAYLALKKVLRRDPDNIDALVLNAELALRRGRPTDSTDIIHRLFELDPASFTSTQLKRLGDTCYRNDLYAMAVQLFDWVGRKKEHDALSLYQLGTCLRRIGSMQRAEQVLLECVQSKPDVAAPYLQLGHVCKAIGYAARAADYYRTFIALSSTEKGTGYWCLADLRPYTFSGEDVADMQRELASHEEDPAQTSALYFALGSAAEKNRDYSAAMQYYDKANAIQARLKPFNARQFRRIVSGLCGVPGEVNAGRADEKPIAILVVGLPRSGTTLIEQILSAHSRVQATDELPFLEKIALRMEVDGGYPGRLAALTDDERADLRRQYINGASAYLRRDSDFFIDKYPGNFLHVGLIRRIMPESIIIDARRDPRDIAISAYRQLFNVRNEFAASFDGIFEYYKGYLAMMRHWQSVYPGQIGTVSYEQLVSSPDQEIAALLDFCGLEREAGCFEFYKHKRAVTTPSVAQVSQPMYTSSVGQWRHYAELTGDAMSRLASLLDEEQKKREPA